MPSLSSIKKKRSIIGGEGAVVVFFFDWHLLSAARKTRDNRVSGFFSRWHASSSVNIQILCPFRRLESTCEADNAVHDLT
jgi:hypothetical protein